MSGSRPSASEKCGVKLVVVKVPRLAPDRFQLIVE
jgi:hypothetical protein